MIIPHKQEIRLVDCDLFGHVNNAIYLTYFEEARITYFTHLFEKNWDWNKNGFIVRKNEVEYLSPIHHNDNIYIEVFLTNIGISSFELTYTIREANKEIIKTIGKSIIVYYDHTIGEKKVIDQKITNMLLKLKQ
jgi:acyl-CoA thioester hydrolase